MITLTALSTKEIIAAILILGSGLLIIAIGFSRRIANWWFKILDKIIAKIRKVDEKILKK